MLFMFHTTPQSFRQPLKICARKKDKLKAAIRECFRAAGVQVVRIRFTIGLGVGLADKTAQER
jgi:hypothetical protein